MIFASNREAEWIRTTPDIRECYGKLFDKESGSSVVMLSPAKNGIILTISKMIPNRYGDNLTAYLYIPNALDISGEALQGIVFDVISSLAHNRRDAVGSCLSSISNSEYEQLSPVDFEQATTNSYAYRNNTNVAIVIQKVIVSCGCTQVEWSGKPTKPGENGEIKVLFSNQIGSGHFDKSIAVYVSSSPNQIILRVRGEVLEAEEKGEATSPAP